MFFCKMHALNMELIQFLYLGANRQNVKGGVCSILVKLVSWNGSGRGSSLLVMTGIVP